VTFVARRLSGRPAPEVVAVASRAVRERLAVARRMEISADVDRVNVHSTARSVPVIQMAGCAGRLSGRPAREIAAVALRAVHERLAVTRRMEMAAEIDRVRGQSAGRFIPMIRMAFRAGRLPDGTSPEAVAMTRGAVEKGLAIAPRVIRPAEIHGMAGPRRHARPALPRANGIVRLPAARQREREKKECACGAKEFLAHNRYDYARHA
jgi:hypothetical protein